MACTQPVRAWQSPGGGPIKWREPVDRKDGTSHFKVPCGRCLSCRMQRGREWAIRCNLELQQHSAACWATLTYDDAHVTRTLKPEHFSGFIKRLRTNLDRSAATRSVASSKIRFFGCGEYGERYGRPHFHVVLFGTTETKAIEQSWTAGIVRVDPVSPAAIAYVAGYCTKKAKQQTYWRRNETYDPETGEVLYEQPDGSLHPEPWQEPFLRMSRRPGIGHHAKTTFRNSWRSSAIYHGREVPAPRTFRQHWKDTATQAELTTRQEEIDAMVAALGLDHNDRLKDAAKIAIAQHHRQAERRKL